MATTRHLDLGCGAKPRNPFHCDEAHAIDLALPTGLDPARFRQANLSLERIPHADSSFDAISAFDFLEHVPRVLSTADGRATRFPFIELMNDIHRVLKPGGRFYALTPAYPNPQAFQDPTHVNFITDGTWEYFCGSAPAGRMYGYTGHFEMRRNERASIPEAFEPTVPLTARRHWRRRWLQWKGKLSHLAWEFVCVKQDM